MAVLKNIILALLGALGDAVRVAHEIVLDLERKTLEKSVSQALCVIDQFGRYWLQQ